MADKKALALQFKASGNAAFTKGDFKTGVEEFTKAIENDPTDHVFFSNRSACYTSLGQYQEALKDADQCIALKPDWGKGYSRRGAALFGLGEYEEAQAAYEKDNTNPQKAERIAECKQQSQKAASNPFGQLFGDSMWAKLATNPRTKDLLNDPAFVAKLKMLQANPSAMGSFAQDPKMMAVISVLLGIDMRSAADPNAATPADAAAAASKPGTASANKTATVADDDEDDDAELPPAKKPAPAAAASPASAPQVPKSAPVEEKKKTSEQKQAEEEKAKGNALYTQKKFAEALTCYVKAQELDSKNATYWLNEGAVHFETKDFDKCVEVCKRGVEIGRENQAGFETIAKLWLRIANAYAAQKKWVETIEAASKSLLEHYSDKAKQLLKKAEEEKKKADELAYLNKDKGLEHKQKGNELFAAGKFGEAITEYTESIRRDPTSAAVYSNRAACYTKLMAWQKGMEDCEKAMALDPKYVKVYIRKAKIQHFLKQYHKALETYNAGLALDPTASELIEGRRQTMMAIQEQAASGKADPERIKEAMKDPEIRQIMQDPTMNKVLGELQSDPRAAQAALQDPRIRNNINKLVAAGILSIG